MQRTTPFRASRLSGRNNLGYSVASTYFFKQAAHDGFHFFQDFILLDKAHFNIELIELTRQTIGTRVFITEARCNLEIAVKARGHDQLLILLRCLR